MARGGKREGAGRPEGTTKPQRLTMVSLRLPVELAEKLRSLAVELNYTQAAIVQMGIEAAERLATKRRRERT